MPFDFRFKTVESGIDRDMLHNFLASQQLDPPYPNYNNWGDKAMEEVRIGYKIAFLVLCYGKPIGDAVAQPHKDFPKSVFEWKNLRVVDDERRGGVAGFLETRLTKIALEEDFSSIICDTRKNPALEAFLTLRGYRQIMKIPTYDSKVEDRFYIKILKGGEGIFIPLKKSIISRAA